MGSKPQCGGSKAHLVGPKADLGSKTQAGYQMASRADTDADFEQKGPGFAGSKTQLIPATKRQGSNGVGSEPQLATTRSKTATAIVVDSETSLRQGPQASSFEKEFHEQRTTKLGIDVQERQKRIWQALVEA